MKSYPNTGTPAQDKGRRGSVGADGKSYNFCTNIVRRLPTLSQTDFSTFVFLCWCYPISDISIINYHNESGQSGHQLSIRFNNIFLCLRALLFPSATFS